MEIIGGIIILLGLVVLYAICCVIAIPMVRKRALVAKRIIIGKESLMTLAKLKCALIRIFDGAAPDIRELYENDYKVSVEVKEGKNSKVTLETKLVRIIFDGKDHIVTDLGHTEKSAVFLAGLILFTYAFTVILFLTLVCALLSMS